MYFRYKLLLGLAIMVILVTDYALAAWGDTQAIPVPAYAEQVKKDVKMIAGAEFDFTYYTSSQDASAIKGFYRSRLTNLGWKENTHLKDLKQTPDLQIDPPLINTLEQNLLFEKDGSTLIINFMPEGFSKDNKTRFTVSKGNLDINAELPEDTDFVPVLLAKPKKDVFPVYPGAALISLSEPPKTIMATYFTKDNIDAVAEFYKTQMPNYGWSLAEEKAPEKINISDGGRNDIAKLCPSCAQNAMVSPEAIEAWMGQLFFSNQKGDSCDVVLSQVVPGKEMPDTFKINTTVLVNYAEKKE